MLDTYLQQMGTLLIDKNLRQSKPDDEVRSVARAQTLTALRRLNGQRKAVVVEFLYESDLVGGDRQMVPLRGADLNRAVLSGADLNGANLSVAVLSLANLGGANLGGAGLSGANLTGAVLSGSKVTEEQLNSARSLEGTTLPDGTILPDDFRGPLPQKASLATGDATATPPAASSNP